MNGFTPAWLFVTETTVQIQLTTCNSACVVSRKLHQTDPTIYSALLEAIQAELSSLCWHEIGCGGAEDPSFLFLIEGAAVGFEYVTRSCCLSLRKTTGLNLCMGSSKGF
jgi:hypothetical protein